MPKLHASVMNESVCASCPIADGSAQAGVYAPRTPRNPWEVRVNGALLSKRARPRRRCGAEGGKGGAQSGVGTLEKWDQPKLTCN